MSNTKKKPITNKSTKKTKSKSSKNYFGGVKKKGSAKKAGNIRVAATTITSSCACSVTCACTNHTEAGCTGC